MSRKSKVKGTAYERELVNQARESGLKAERAYASNGKSLGHAEEVDLVINGKRIQAKRRRKLLKGIRDLAADLEHNDSVVFREDGSHSLVLLSWWEYLDLIALAD